MGQIRMRKQLKAEQNIAEGVKVLLFAALIACMWDVGFSLLVHKHSPVMASLGLPQNQIRPSLVLVTPSQQDSTVAEHAPEEVPAPTTVELIHPLQRFFASLIKLQQGDGTVRIGYFGDSMIEGDLVTQSLRNSLQQKLGGQGVGFVPIKSQTYGFRRSIWHRFSGDWEDFNLLMPKAGPQDYGISGEYFLTRRVSSSGQTWVRYKGADIYEGTKQFDQVRLFYGRRKNRPGDTDHQYVISRTDQGEDTLYLNQRELVNEVLVSNQSTEEVKLNFRIPKDLPIYGLSFESSNGLFIDNFASRGNSGMNLIQIPGPTLAQFHEHLDYDLIVLQFGLNVISTRRKDFSHYERGMERVIRHFQEHAPDADILLIGVSDKSTQFNGQLQTDPSVPLILETQRRVAERTGVAFLDLYDAMGGHNSMIQWVKNDLARSDYTHPNRQGAERVGEIVEEYIWRELDHYQHGDSNAPGSYALLHSFHMEP